MALRYLVSKMKIILVDNFDRNRINDILIVSNINKIWGERIVNLLNDKFSGNHSADFFKLVEDNHKLHKFEP